VDPSTAVLIRSSPQGWSWSVYGDGNAYLVTPPTSPLRLTARWWWRGGNPRFEDHGRLTYGPVTVYRLPATGAAGARTLAQITSGPPSYHLWVSAGAVYTTENGGSLY
jgi:hypothetical protein